MNHRATKLAVVVERDGWDCHYCGTELELSTATLDHVIPASKGGRHTTRNLVLACGPCNVAKGAQDYKTFTGRQWRRPWAKRAA